jgi:hypothetical protein
MDHLESKELCARLTGSVGGVSAETVYENLNLVNTQFSEFSLSEMSDIFHLEGMRQWADTNRASLVNQQTEYPLPPMSFSLVCFQPPIRSTSSARSPTDIWISAAHAKATALAVCARPLPSHGLSFVMDNPVSDELCGRLTGNVGGVPAETVYDSLNLVNTQFSEFSFTVMSEIFRFVGNYLLKASPSLLFLEFLQAQQASTVVTEREEGVCRPCFLITWVAEICIRAAAVLPSDQVSRPGYLLKALVSCRHLLLSSVTGCSTTWGFISFGNYLLKARPLPSRCIFVISTLEVTRHGSP